jgi:CheY-like chemotaxis protein
VSVLLNWLSGDDALALIQSVHQSFSGSNEQKPNDGKDGLSNHIDVMLLDIRMPGKSGLDVMQEAPRPLPFPVVAMTGNVDKESLEEYRWAPRLCCLLSCSFEAAKNHVRRTGFCGCIGKPFEKKMMKEAVRMALEGRWFCLQ